MTDLFVLAIVKPQEPLVLRPITFFFLICRTRHERRLEGGKTTKYLDPSKREVVSVNECLLSINEVKLRDDHIEELSIFVYERIGPKH